MINYLNFHGVRLDISQSELLHRALILLAVMVWIVFSDFLTLSMGVFAFGYPFPLIWLGGGGGGGGSAGDSGGGSGVGGTGTGDTPGGSASTCSTPFLELLHPDGKVQILNDIMVGSPSSLFGELKDGAEAFKRGDVGYDIYAVPLSLLKQKTNQINFSLKEIEIENSVISTFEYAPVALSEGEEIYTSDNYQKPLTAQTVKRISGHIKHSSGKNVSKNLNLNFKTPLTHNQPIDTSIELKAGESLDFTATKISAGPIYISTAAFWRNIIGYQHYLAIIASGQAVARVRSPYMRFILRPVVYMSAFVLSLASMFGTTSIGVDDSILDLSYKVKSAHASTPSGKSLYYYYQDAAQNWVHFSTIHPRYNLSHRALSPIPEEAFVHNGVANIRITANNVHYIHSLELASGVEEVTSVNFIPVEGVLNNLSQEMNVTSELHTAPGDTYSFSTEVPDTATHILFKIHGYYSPAKLQSAAEVQDWWGKLSSNERSLFLKK